MTNLPRDSWCYHRDTKTAELAGRIADTKRAVYAAFPRWLRWIPWLLMKGWWG